MLTRVFVRIVVASMLLAMVVLAVSFEGTTPTTNAAPAAGSCVTSNLRAWDMGGGTPWNRNFVIDVYGTRNSSGFFLYYDPLAGGWRSIRWSPWYLLSNGVRFGVSTAWAYTHPWWQNTAWRYVYPC